MAKRKNSNKGKIRPNQADARKPDVPKKEVDRFIASQESAHLGKSLETAARAGISPSVDANISTAEWARLSRIANQAQSTMRNIQDSAAFEASSAASSEKMAKELVAKKTGFDPDTGEPRLYTPMRRPGAPESLPALSRSRWAEGSVRGVAPRIISRRRYRATRPHAFVEEGPIQPVEGSPVPLGGGGTTSGGHYVTAQERMAAVQAARNPVKAAKDRQKPWAKMTDFTSAPENTVDPEPRGGALLANPRQLPNVLNLSAAAISKLEAAEQGVAINSRGEVISSGGDPDVIYRQTSELGDVGYLGAELSRKMLKSTKHAEDTESGESPTRMPGVHARGSRVTVTPIRSSTLVGPAFQTLSESKRRQVRIRKGRGNLDRPMSAQAQAKAAEINVRTHGIISAMQSEYPFGQERKPEGAIGRILGYDPDSGEIGLNEGDLSGVSNKALSRFMHQRFGAGVLVESGPHSGGSEASPSSLGSALQRRGTQLIVPGEGGKPHKVIELGPGSFVSEPFLEDANKVVNVPVAGSSEIKREWQEKKAAALAAGTEVPKKPKIKVSPVVISGKRRGTSTKVTKIEPEKMDEYLANREAARQHEIRTRDEEVNKSVLEGKSVKANLTPEEQQIRDAHELVNRANTWKRTSIYTPGPSPLAVASARGQIRSANEAAWRLSGRNKMLDAERINRFQFTLKAIAHEQDLKDNGVQQPKGQGLSAISSAVENPSGYGWAVKNQLDTSLLQQSRPRHFAMGYSGHQSDLY